MRLIGLILLFLISASGAWAQCSTSNLSACPSPPFNAVLAATLAGNASAATVTGNGVTSPLSLWTGYLAGAVNPNPMVLTGPSTAAIIADAAQLTVKLNNPTLTADHLYACIISASCGSTVNVGDAIRGIATNTPGSTALITTGLAGYVLNQQAQASGAAVTAALNGLSICAVDNSACWGVNTLQSDNLAGLQVSSGVGRSLFNEFDFNVTSPSTTGGGLMLGGTWLVQPTAGINGFSVTTPWGACGTGPCAPFAKWANGFIVANGAASVGMNIGAAAFTPAASVASMPIVLGYFDASSASQNATWTATTFGGAGQMALGGTVETSLFVVNGGYKLSATTVAALPACNSGRINQLRAVSDATAPTYNGALTGGGTVIVPVFCNGAAWTSH